MLEFRSRVSPVEALEQAGRVFRIGRKFPLHMFGFVGKYNPILTTGPASVPSGVLLTLSNPFSVSPLRHAFELRFLICAASSKLANLKTGRWIDYCTLVAGTACCTILGGEWSGVWEGMIHFLSFFSSIRIFFLLIKLKSKVE